MARVEVSDVVPRTSEGNGGLPVPPGPAGEQRGASR